MATSQLQFDTLGLFFCGPSKISVTPYKPETIDALKLNIREAIGEIQELKPIGHPMRFCFAKWACERLVEDGDFGKKKNYLVR